MQNAAVASAFDPEEGPDAVAARAADNALAGVAELASIDPTELSANALLNYVGVLGNITRLVEGRQVANVGDIARRSDTDAGFDGLAARHGAKSPTALFETITGAKNSTAYRYTKLAKHTTPRVSDTGLPLEPVFVQTADALAQGTIGLDVAESITSTLAPILPRVAPEQIDWAEATLIGNATGAYGEVPLTADAIRGQARVFRVALDPDGVEPTAEELHEARKLVFKHQDDGSMKITGTLSPEQAAIVTPVFDACMSKRTSPTFMETEELSAHGQEPEPRSKPQERADAFTAMIAGVGKMTSTPKLHGRGPTVMVTVKNEDLDAGTGAAWSPGTPAPLPMSFVTQMQCDGDTMNVTIDEHGDVLNLGTAQRLSTAKQRLALIARDGNTCAAAADCDIPAWLCEAHHVQRWENGGRTDVANGLIVCWYHHRLLERGEWSLTRDKNGHPRLIPPGWYVNRRYLGRRRRITDNEDDDRDPPDDHRDTGPRT
ncbi:HNH endonuclease signature motif containing protein [Paramicrobacterium fandaimingii]|uniref:HNH endonuclease signature motif containing protein n=1 Tax=Paramicrobacterium fandaimingii TaxID=2708079 RepID=UPI00141E3253|nr:HNH endonuclease signature motif containing protein [Microbacterium fandaimingii]